LEYGIHRISYLSSRWSVQDMASDIPILLAYRHIDPVKIWYLAYPRLLTYTNRRGDNVMIYRFRRTPNPMEECTYSELFLLWTFQFEYCCFVLNMCDISTAPHTPCTNLTNTLNILSLMTNHLHFID
jgi:hypothetical protein